MGAVHARASVPSSPVRATNSTGVAGLPALLAACATAALAVAGCGGDGEEAPATPDRPQAVEAADELPALPRGWEPFANPGAGVALGRPPGWKADEDGTVTRLTAPDELVVVSISADRTNEAFDLPPGEFARQTAAALTGYREPLEPSRPKPFRHRYDGAQVAARGVAAKSGVRQDVRVVVIRRDGLAVVTAVVAANAEPGSAAEVRAALQALETLRTRPVR